MSDAERPGPDRPTRSVVLVAVDGTPLLNLTGPADVFAAANHVLAQARDGSGAEPAYGVSVATVTGEPVAGSAGIRIAADLALATIQPQQVDTLIVTGGPADGPADSDLTNAVRRIAPHARRTCSVCTGAFVLAAAGLLDGRRATTHWAVSPLLQRRYPATIVEADQIYIRDGSIATSGGVSAGIDLALDLVEQDLGATLARSAARWLVVFNQRPGNQAQFSERLTLPPDLAHEIRQVADHVVANPTDTHTVARLAQRASLSERHFARLFTQQTGHSPARFVERVRVERARELLERTTAPNATIAARAGFANREALRRAFQRTLNTTPTEYRARFNRST